MPIPKTHTAYRLHSKGLDGLKKVQEEVPEVGPNQVLIQTKAVSLNSRDLQIINGRYPMPAIDNVVPCSDLAGKVVKLGNNVSEFKIGDKVISNFKVKNVHDLSEGLDSALGAAYDGVLREYVVLPQEAVNKLNSDISWEHAASLVCTGVTTWNALYGLKRLTPGDVVLVLGTGGVSLTALAIAKKAGAVTIATSSSDQKLQQVGSQLADYTINYTDNPEWADKVLEITGGKGADFIIENGGIGTIKQSIKACAAEGVISLIGFVAPRPKKNPDVFTAAFMRGAILRGIRVGNKQMAQELIKFVEHKGLEIRVDKVFSYHNDEVMDAFKLLEASGHTGKICISFDNSSSKL